MQPARSSSVLYFAGPLLIAPIVLLATVATFFGKQISIGLWLVSEDGPVELLGAIASLFASVLFLSASTAARRQRLRLSRVWLLLLAMASFFLFAEEISWGQRVVGVETPQWLSPNSYQNEINIHNLNWFLSGDRATNHFDAIGQLSLAFLLLALPVLHQISPIRGFLSRHTVPVPRLSISVGYLLAKGLVLLPGILPNTLPLSPLHQTFALTEMSEAVIETLVLLFAWDAYAALAEKSEPSARRLSLFLSMAAALSIVLIVRAPAPPPWLDPVARAVASGQQWASLGNHQQAQEDFQEAYQLDPESTEAAVGLGGELLVQHRFDEALAIYREAIVLEPNNPEIHLGLGICWLVKGSPRSAEEHFLRTLQLDPNSLMARQKLGALFLAQRRLGEATAQFQEVLRRDPESTIAWISLGQSHLWQNDLQRAQDCFEAAKQTDPDNPDVLNYLGVILSQRGNNAKARSLFREALRADPNHTEAQTNLTLLESPANSSQ